MANAIKRANLNYDDMATFLSSVGCPLVTKIDDTHISIDNHVTLTYTYQQDYISINGGADTTCGRLQDPRTETTVVWNNNLFYYQTYYLWDNNTTQRSVVFYEQTGDTAWCGYQYTDWSARHTFYSLTDIPIYNIDDTTLTGYHRSAVNYGITPGYIDYTPYSLIVNGNNLQSVDSNFISCSTVTPEQVVTFDHKNYFAIGTNSLILLDRN